MERYILLALLLLSALAWGAYGWLTAKPMHPLLALRTIIVGGSIAYLTAFAFMLLAEGMLYIASLRYRRAKQYEGARKRCRRRRLRARRKP